MDGRGGEEGKGKGGREVDAEIAVKKGGEDKEDQYKTMPTKKKKKERECVETISPLFAVAFALYVPENEELRPPHPQALSLRSSCSFSFLFEAVRVLSLPNHHAHNRTPQLKTALKH